MNIKYADTVGTDDCNPILVGNFFYNILIARIAGFTESS